MTQENKKVQAKHGNHPHLRYCITITNILKQFQFTVVYYQHTRSG